MLIKFWASNEQRLQAHCQTLDFFFFFLWCAHLRLRNLNPWHHFWETSIQTHRIHFGKFLLLTRFYHIWQKARFDSPPFLELDLELIKEWKKCEHPHPWKEIWSQSFWICIFIASWSFFPPPHLFSWNRSFFFFFLFPQKEASFNR